MNRLAKKVTKETFKPGAVSSNGIIRTEAGNGPTLSGECSGYGNTPGRRVRRPYSPNTTPQSLQPRPRPTDNRRSR